jgi:hypothetical protein
MFLAEMECTCIFTILPVVPGLFDTINADIVPCCHADTRSGPEKPPIDSGDLDVLVRDPKLVI